MGEKTPRQAYEFCAPQYAAVQPAQPNSHLVGRAPALKNSFALCLRVGDYNWKLGQAADISEASKVF